MINSLQISLNPMRITLLSVFGGVRGRYAGGRKDVYFIRWTGCPSSTDPLPALLKDAGNMALRACAAGSGYFCAKQLDKFISPTSLPLYQSCYEKLAEGKSPSGRPFSFGEPLLNNAYDLAFGELLRLYQKCFPKASSTMVKNFGIKLLHWSAHVLPRLFPNGSLAGGTPKFLWLGAPHEAEYLFLILLTRLGCDVAIFHPAGELSLPEELLAMSACVSGDAHPQVSFPDTCCTPFAGQEQDLSPAASPVKQPSVPKKPPVHPSRPPVAASNPSPPPQAVSRPSVVRSSPSRQQPIARPSPSQATPLSYEQLAKLAPSVVMIEVMDEYGQCKKTGSGVLIGDGNLILTNFHVVQGGRSYSIQMENDEHSYSTDELLKYHSLHDLALLRLPCPGRPIPIYNGPPLARGQNVVAIGSPLGLFNSVSDGIIAGFRQFEEVSMIQFTAPTSPGSSGGALLNQYGALIGIITAGFREGQNLNLAVDYQTIRQFARGFLPQGV